MKAGPRRIALIGTGYIADYHAAAIAATPGVLLVAVCDTVESRARDFAARWGLDAGSAAFASLDQMCERCKPDAVHILTPPDHHAAVAAAVLQRGIAVLLEKPMCAEPTECARLVELAQQHSAIVGVSHNFLFHPAYEELRREVQSGRLGRVDHLIANWHRPLPLIKSGPFNNWMLRDPANIMLETGSHLVGCMLDLLGAPQRMTVDVTRPIDIPGVGSGGGRFYRRWQVHGWCGDAAVDLNSSFIDGYPRFSLEVRGTLGVATVEFDDNTCTVQRSTPLSVDFDRFARIRRAGASLKRRAWGGLGRYVAAKLKLVKASNAYEQSIHSAVASFYGSLQRGEPLDARLSADFGRAVVEQGVRIGDLSGVRGERPPEPPEIGAVPVASTSTPDTSGEVLVLGGTGFIGREVVRQLLDRGYTVRLLSRSGSAGAINSPAASERLRVFRGDISDRAALDEAMRGVEAVLHLARAQGRTWDDYVKQDIEPTRQVAQLCLEHSVRRLVYTSTIDSLYNGCGTITDDTPPDPQINRRNYYARCKAEIERMLMTLHRERKLPVVIMRPGVVIGAGSSPCHWGVGMWNGAGVVQYWGDGETKLPLVLVEDVAAALIRGIETPGIEGRCFNLVDDPMLTAREYVAEVEQRGRIKIDQHTVPIMRFFLADYAKWLVKRAVGHPDGVRRPSYRDWASRTNRAVYDCRDARRVLNWQPCSNRSRMIERGIHQPVDEMLA